MEAASLAPHEMGLAEALDVAALTRLGHTYCHAIDRRDFSLLRTLYDDDAIDDHGPMFCGGPDAFVTWLPKAMASWDATTHIIHNALFLIAGDEADGELVNTAYHRALDGTHEVIVHGRYLDQYRKRDGIWRFFRRGLVLDWMEQRPLAAASGFAEGVEVGEASAEDPCYRRLPLFAAQRLRREKDLLFWTRIQL